MPLSVRACTGPKVTPATAAGAGPRPVALVRAPADAEPGADVLVNGEPAPPGRVVRLINSAGGFLDDRGYGGDIGDNTPDDGQFDEQSSALPSQGALWSPGTWAGPGPLRAVSSPTTRMSTGVGGHSWPDSDRL